MYEHAYDVTSWRGIWNEIFWEYRLINAVACFNICVLEALSVIVLLYFRLDNVHAKAMQLNEIFLTYEVTLLILYSYVIRTGEMGMWIQPFFVRLIKKLDSSLFGPLTDPDNTDQLSYVELTLIVNYLVYR